MGGVYTSAHERKMLFLNWNSSATKRLSSKQQMIKATFIECNTLLNADKLIQMKCMFLM